MHILSTGTCTCTELDRASELEVAENAPTILYLYLLYLTNLLTDVLCLLFVLNNHFVVVVVVVFASVASCLLHTRPCVVEEPCQYHLK